MRLVCPNCDAAYEVDDTAIPDSGRDVQCSNCGHTWFQMHPDAPGFADDGFEPEDDLPPAPALPEQEDFPAAAALTDDTPEPAPDPPATRRRPMDENALAVLREEAEREAAARRTEVPRGVEMQTELGLDDPVSGAAARRVAQMKGLEALPENPAPAPAPVVQPARRELLPDIEEINSTLRPSAERGRDVAPTTPAADAQAARRRGFRSGFALMVLLAAGLAVLYVLAPGISRQIPGAAPAMQSYVTAVDGLRDGLDAAIESATDQLNGLAGSGG